MTEEGELLALYDVLIIGAGPCGLAVASRLREETPSAMFTDEEQQRYQWIRKHKRSMSVKNGRKLNTMTITVPASSTCATSMVVLDESGAQWMSRWDSLFRTFEISHLRSPMFFHVDPRDRDGLLSYTHEQSKDDELIEISGCVGRERSKHQRKKDRHGARGFHEPAIDERDRKDYFTPSTPLFKCHCEEVARKYDLNDGLVKRETVNDIDHGYFEHISETSKVFEITTNRRRWYARTVVLSVGAGNVPHMPDLPGVKSTKGACHAMHIQHFPHPTLEERINNERQTEVIIVGGGLTAAHLAANAIQKGVSRVHMILRGKLKVKPFDVDLSWMGKFRNYQQASFWSADTDEERLEQIQAARGGGSMTPRIHKILRRYLDNGRLLIHQNTTISAQKYDEADGYWTVNTTPQLVLPKIDYIYCATGIPSDFSKLEYLQTMLRKYPIEGKGGMPCLNNDMAWGDDVPLYVTGKLAGLRIGPGAGNLAGARIGAERIAWSIQEKLECEKRDEKDVTQRMDQYILGIGNRYQSLTGSETDFAGTDLSDDSSSS